MSLVEALGRGGLVSRATSLARALSFHVSLDALLFWCAGAVFLVSRLDGIERFPIYFFTDEAVQTVRAAQFVDKGFHDAQGRLFPTYFQNGPYFNLSFSVYAQVIPYKLFGYSVFATRATSALIAFSGTMAAGLILKDILRVRAWWLGVLFLTITPAWFLHSRTAFETAEATALYAWFLYFYLRYRLIRPRNLFPALLFGALAFYAYSSIQLVVVATGAGFALSDARYHLRQWRTCLGGVVFLAILALPYARFDLQQGHEVYSHLRTLGSYWVQPGLSLQDKLSRFWREYSRGLSPGYWYGSAPPDLSRHLMRGYGHILVYTAPLFALGLGYSLARIRRPEFRAVLIALLAAPTGGALVATGITRDMAMVVPVAVLTGVGGGLLLALLARYVPYPTLAAASFATLTAASLFMLHDALQNGPTWYQNYGLYGMQYGARQVADAVKAELAEHPEERVLISPSWTNGGDVVFRFLLSDEQRYSLGGATNFTTELRPIPPNTVFVMTPEEWTATASDAKISDIQSSRTVQWPSGKVGFYFVTFRYSSSAAEIFAAEDRARREPVTDTVKIMGQAATVLHSKFDLGATANVFDSDNFTLARTLIDNPAIIDVSFPSPIEVQKVHIVTASLQLALKVAVFAPDGTVEEFSLTVPGPPKEQDVTVDTGAAPRAASRIRIEVQDTSQPSGKAHVHIREISFR